jgi:3',5'-cyclic AMP phosphodiesterase CpdA
MDGFDLALLAGGAWIALSVVVQAAALRAAALAQATPPACFSRPVKPRADGAVHLAFLGDVQRGVSSVAPALPAAVAALEAPLLVSSGDLVSHGEGPYYGILCRAFARAALEVPVRVVPGNHDLLPRRSKDDRIGGREFERCFGPRRWSMTLGPVLVVGLDVGNTQLYEGEQREWLGRTLAQHPGAAWICVSHRPPFQFDREGEPAFPDLRGLHEDLKARPPLFHLSGHLNRWADRTVDGVRYLVNAHGGVVHGYDPGLGGFELLRVRLDAGSGLEVERTRHRRRRDLRALLDQVCVRLWDERRRYPWRAIAAPGALLFRLLGRYEPVVRHPVQRRYPGAPDASP